MRRLFSTFGHGSPGAGSCRCARLPVSVLSSMASWYCALNRRWYPRYCTPSRPVLDFCSSQHIVDADRRSGRGGRRVVVRLLVRTSVALDHDGNPVCRPGTDRTGRLIARCPPFRVGELTRHGTTAAAAPSRAAGTIGVEPTAFSGARSVHACARISTLPVTSWREASDSLWKTCGQDDGLAERISSSLEKQ